jgi:hypothetical protein
MRRSLLVLVALLVLATPGARANQPDVAGMTKPVTELQKAIQDKNRAAFKALWHADGYAKNLVGQSGLSGEQVFDQATRKGWFPRPVPARLHQDGRGGPYVMPIEIYSPSEQRVLGPCRCGSRRESGGSSSAAARSSRRSWRSGAAGRPSRRCRRAPDQDRLERDPSHPPCVPG